jgi:hypothetical protein
MSRIPVSSGGRTTSSPAHRDGVAFPERAASPLGPHHSPMSSLSIPGSLSETRKRQSKRDEVSLLSARHVPHLTTCFRLFAEKLSLSWLENGRFLPLFINVQIVTRTPKLAKEL